MNANILINPLKLTDHRFTDEVLPLVSISCITFNHVDYIRVAIEGFLMQQTTFPVEILIHDDASTDGTADIIKEYESLYPHIIKPIYQVENQYSKGIKISITYNYPRARGKYIALCEGDDYWTDPMKLQKQIELLRSYPDAIMSVAQSDVYEQKGSILEFSHRTGGNEDGLSYSIKSYFHTSTFVISTEILGKAVNKYLKYGRFGDTAMFNVLLVYGPYIILPEPVSVYRVTGTGIWTSLNTLSKAKWEFSVAKKLSTLLPGRHRINQMLKARGYSKTILMIYVRDRMFGESIVWALYLFYFSVFAYFFKVKSRLFNQD